MILLNLNSENQEIPEFGVELPGARWLGLDVRRHDRIDADHEIVEFVARVRIQGRASRIHEISRFTRVEGVWVYVDGDIRPT